MLYIEPYKRKQIMEQAVAKPVLKWAGGKRKLLPQLEQKFPMQLTNNAINNYIEPFIGGGAVFFDITAKYKIDNALLCDINPELVILYNVIKNDADDLISELFVVSDEYLALNEEGRKEKYYIFRDEYNAFDKQINANKYNQSFVRRAALTVFLNRTCFNGLYRVNKKGRFNVPFGRYKNPKILDAENILAASSSLQVADIIQSDFSSVIDNVTANTFIYYDPPYRPVSTTSSFTSYASDDFDDEEQRRLKSVFDKAHSKGALQMLSNSDPTNYVEDCFFDDLYKDYNIGRVSASRRINSNSDGRGEIREILVTNY